MGSRRPKKAADAPRSLASIFVDVTTRLGAVAPFTTTGIRALDGALGGGLRSGTHLVIAGGPGVGKTAFALMLAYMAARARAAVLFAGVGLDETEMVARLTARALHREYQNVEATYGTIWSGLSLQDEAWRAPITSCLGTVTKKVGEHLHLYAAEPMQDVSTLADQAALLWARNERVVIVVDGLEGFTTPLAGPAQALDARLLAVAYELTRLAAQGCAVVTTVSAAAAPAVVTAATVAAELRVVREQRTSKKKVQLGARPVDLDVLKNRLGPTPTVPLLYVAAASVFEERTP